MRLIKLNEFFQFKAKIDVKAHLSITVEMNTHTEVSQSSSTWLLSPVGFEFEGFWKKKKKYATFSALYRPVTRAY